MFDELSDKLALTLKKVRGHGKLSENNIQDALREVRLNLLSADVNYNVVRQFIRAVKQRALGKEVSASLTPGQQFIRIVAEEMTEVMGGTATELDLAAKPPVPIMLVGLQGSGKTTSCGKLAAWLRKQGRSSLLVPVDVYRPAAIEQLKTVGRQLGIDVYDTQPGDKPLDIARAALAQAERQGQQNVILDTAGRLHVDESMMAELRELKEVIQPKRILLVVDAMTGQDAVNVAERFNADLEVDGFVLTKLDGDARGGAALSIRAVTGKPIYFAGMGEKLDALELFHPDRVAQRVLGMGDMLTLIEKTQEAYDAKQAEKTVKKLRKNEFTLDDFLSQVQQIRKLGPLEDVMKMIPGMGQAMKKMKNMAPPEQELKKIEAIIRSMTVAERQNHTILNASRRRRIALGSGTTVQDINKFLKRYTEAQKMMKRFSKLGVRGLRGMMPGF